MFKQQIIKAEGLLKSANLKITVPRMEVLSVLLKEHGPFSAKEIFEKLPQKCCDQATVFRILKQLKANAIIQDVLFDGEKVHYEIQDEHHHHIICEKCGKRAILHSCFLHKLEEEANSLKFKVLHHRIELIGLCTHCQSLFD